MQDHAAAPFENQATMGLNCKRSSKKKNLTNFILIYLKKRHVTGARLANQADKHKILWSIFSLDCYECAAALLLFASPAHDARRTCASQRTQVPATRPCPKAKFHKQAVDESGHLGVQQGRLVRLGFVAVDVEVAGGLRQLALLNDT
jgi:hypothetical protein